MRLIGLTGGIASGKSTASRIIYSNGISIIDCDEVARKSSQKSNWGWRRILKAFGPNMLLANGEIDREALGRLVFADKAARRKLNSATHLPIMVDLIKQLLWKWMTCHWIVVIDMPLLFETGAQRFCHRSVLIACSPELQKARLIGRDKCTAEEAQNRIDSQMPLDKKLALADIVIQNDSDVGTLENKLKHTLKHVGRHSIFWGIITSPVAFCSMSVLLFRALNAVTAPAPAA